MKTLYCRKHFLSEKVRLFQDGYSDSDFVLSVVEYLLDMQTFVLSINLTQQPVLSY